MADIARSRLRAAATLVGAGLVVVVLVLPAERGIDITGLGAAIGLTEMGLVKMEIAAEIAADEAFAEKIRVADSLDAADSGRVAREDLLPPEQRSAAARHDTTTINLPPYGRGEISVSAASGKRVSYSWTAQPDPLDFIAFGDSNAAAGSYHLYNQANARHAKTGVISAAFAGRHGWRWRSWSNLSITLVLITRGDYSEIRVGDR